MPIASSTRHPFLKRVSEVPPVLSVSDCSSTSDLNPSLLIQNEKVTIFAATKSFSTVFSIQQTCRYYKLEIGTDMEIIVEPVKRQRRGESSNSGANYDNFLIQNIGFGSNRWKACAFGHFTTSGARIKLVQWKCLPPSESTREQSRHGKGCSSATEQYRLDCCRVLGLYEPRSSNACWPWKQVVETGERMWFVALRCP